METDIRQRWTTVGGARGQEARADTVSLGSCVPADPEQDGQARGDALTEFELRLAALERGAAAVAFASGSDAADAVLREAGAEVVAAADIGPVARAALVRFAARGGRVVWVDGTDPVSVAGAITTSTGLVWVGAPIGASLAVPDIRALAAITRLAGARLVVDASPWTASIIRPLELGADASIVTEPATLVGAIDAAIGVVTVRDGRWSTKLATDRKAPPKAEILRAALGLDTLALRLQRRELAALLVARRLAESPHARRVWFAGLESFPQRAVVKAQAHGVGPVLAAEIRGGPARVEAALRRLRVWSPIDTQSRGLAGGNRSQAWIDAASGRVVLSAGLEDPRDLIDELEWALRVTAELAEIRVRPAAAEEASEAA